MIAALALLAQAIGAGPAFDEPELPDEVLAEQRGGVRLPNGIDVVLTVQTQTAVNGSIVLQTVYSLIEGPPETVIYVPPPGQTVAAQPGGSSAGAQSTNPTVTFDSRNGLQVTPGISMIPVAVSSGSAGGETGVPDGLVAVDGAAPVLTDAGRVTQTAGNSVRSVVLTGPDLEVVHFSGNAFGSAIANAGSDRAINTATTVSIDLRNAGPDVLGSTMLRVEDVALGAVASRL